MQKKVDPFLGHRWKDLTLEELAIIIDGKILFKEQMEKVAERVRKIGLPTQPIQGNYDLAKITKGL
jgi:hypothetical protein